MSQIFKTICFAHKSLKNLNNQIPQRLCSSLITKLKPETTLVPLDNVTEEINWEKELLELRKESKESILEPCKEDLSFVAPYIRPTFNFAAYINKSETLQKLVQLGVDLHKIEKKKAPEYIMKLDFENDIKKHVFFLHDLGVTAELLGDYLTKNPFIFQEDIDTLAVRVNYLQSKAFDTDMITRIVMKNPYWLMFSTKRIDGRLGHFQKTFQLKGKEVRELTTKQPRLITYNMQHIKLNTFSIKEEMGFDDAQMKTLLLKIPKLWMMSQKSIINRFSYIHNTMNITHEQLVAMPDVLTCRETRLRQRHQFLLRLGRAQYDPTKVNYVSLEQLVQGTDADFSTNLAKSSVHAFNTFLKSL